MISNIIQVFLGIFIIVILMIIAFLVFNYERIDVLRNANNIKKKIKIFKGIYDYTRGEEYYDTFNKFSSTYKELIPSINQKGGAEYSYSFWLYMDRSKLAEASANNEDIILFLRGSKKKIPYFSISNCKIQNHQKYYLVKNPLIRLDRTGSSIVIEYNTLTNPDAYRINGTGIVKCDSESSDDKNAGSLGIYDLTKNEIYNQKWFMFTVVLKEITPENDILNKFKTICKIYLNDILMLDRIVEGPYNGVEYEENEIPGTAAMKHNKGPLYLNPGNNIREGNDDTLQMADLTYYNYALEANEIKNIFNNGFNKTPFQHEINENSEGYIIANIGNNSRSRVKQY
jgi:hypothetical protein